MDHRPDTISPLKEGHLAERVAVAFLLSVIAFLAVVKFDGPSDIYQTVLAGLRDPAVFATDYFLSETVYTRGSLFYAFFQLTGIPIERDDVGLAIHLLLSAVSVWFAFRIFRDHLGLDDAPKALLAVLVCCFLSGQIIAVVRPSVIGSMSSNPTAMAQMLGFVVLYTLLCRRVLLASLLILLTLMMTAKGTFILVPLAGLFVLLDGRTPTWRLIYLAIPTGYVGFKALAGGGPEHTFEEMVLLSDIAIQREDMELAFHMQPWPAWTLFALAVIATPFLARAVPSGACRALLFAAMGAAVAVALFGTVYTAWFYQIYPNSMFILISPPRAMKYFAFLVSAVSVAWILRSAILTGYEKLAGLFAVILLKAIPMAMAVAAALVLMAALPRLAEPLKALFARLDELVWRRTGGQGFVCVMGGLILAFVLIRLPVSYAGVSNIDWAAYDGNRTWTHEIFASPQAWADWKALAEEPADHALLCIFKPTDSSARYAFAHACNPVARKRFFTHDPSHAYLDVARWREAMIRQGVTEKIVRQLNQGEAVGSAPIGELPLRKFDLPMNLEQSIPELMADRGSKIIVPADAEALFPTATTRRTVGGHVLLGFD
ncbi:MAG: hypothetical protein ACPGOV_08840 [Magnetovibrionaceae bacterium]